MSSRTFCLGLSASLVLAQALQFSRTTSTSVPAIQRRLPLLGGQASLSGLPSSLEVHDDVRKCKYPGGRQPQQWQLSRLCESAISRSTSLLGPFIWAHLECGALVPHNLVRTPEDIAPLHVLSPILAAFACCCTLPVHLASSTPELRRHFPLQSHNVSERELTRVQTPLKSSGW